MAGDIYSWEWCWPRVRCGGALVVVWGACALANRNSKMRNPQRTPRRGDHTASHTHAARCRSLCLSLVSVAANHWPRSTSRPVTPAQPSTIWRGLISHPPSPSLPSKTLHATRRRARPPSALAHPYGCTHAHTNSLPPRPSPAAPAKTRTTTRKSTHTVTHKRVLEMVRREESSRS